MPNNIAPHLKSVEHGRGCNYAVLIGKTLIGISDTFGNDLSFVAVTDKNSRKPPKQKGVRGGQLQSPLVFAVRQDVERYAPIAEFKGARYIVLTAAMTLSVG